MMTASSKLRALLIHDVNYIKNSRNHHKAAQQVAEKLDTLTGGVSDVAACYINLLDILTEGMAAVPMVMGVEDFKERGAGSAGVRFMGSTGDHYFINSNLDGVTPFTLTTRAALDLLGYYINFLKD